jgi:hypothetical protein
MQRYNSFALLSLILLFAVWSPAFIIHTNTEMSPFSIYLMNDLELFTSYLFKTHQHYMFLSIFLLLMALFLSVFLSTKFVGKTITKNYSLSY